MLTSPQHENLFWWESIITSCSRTDTNKNLIKYIQICEAKILLINCLP